MSDAARPDHQDSGPLDNRKQRRNNVLSILYHELSYDDGDDGAVAALNALLQGPYFDSCVLAELAAGGPNDAYSLNAALRAFDLCLEPYRAHLAVSSPSLLPAAHRDPSAFLCYQEERWFVLRRFGVHWVNLNGFICQPAQLVTSELALCLSQLEDDGCIAYVVVGKLPMCEATSSSLFDSHFNWGVSDELGPDKDYIREQGHVCTHECEHDAEHCNENHCPHHGDYCGDDEDYAEDAFRQAIAESSHDAFEADLHAAIAASLQDMSKNVVAPSLKIVSGDGSNGARKQKESPLNDPSAKPKATETMSPPTMSMVSTDEGSDHHQSRPYTDAEDHEAPKHEASKQQSERSLQTPKQSLNETDEAVGVKAASTSR